MLTKHMLTNYCMKGFIKFLQQIVQPGITSHLTVFSFFLVAISGSAGESQYISFQHQYLVLCLKGIYGFWVHERYAALSETVHSVVLFDVNCSKWVCMKLWQPIYIWASRETAYCCSSPHILKLSKNCLTHLSLFQFLFNCWLNVLLQHFSAVFCDWQARSQISVHYQIIKLIFLIAAGRISLEDIQKAVLKLRAGKLQVYLCGPSPMIQAMEEHCVSCHITKQQIFYERWW